MTIRGTPQGRAHSILAALNYRSGTFKLPAHESNLYAGEGAKVEYSGHAQVAYEHGALRVLAQLGQSGQQVADAAMSGLHSTILMPLLAGMVAAFGMSPTSLPQEDLGHMLQLFWTVYEGESPDLYRAC